MTRVDSTTVVERGSLWHWLSNKHQYDHLEEDIDRMLWDWVPDICEVLDVPRRPIAPRLLQPFEVTDCWAAESPARWDFPWLTVAIRAPLAVRTHLFKHKFGFVENEISRRYVDAPPQFFIPETWRKRAPGIKQGSLPCPARGQWFVDLLARATYGVGKLGYRALLALGVCPEQARFVLPEGRLTEWYWTGSLAAINRAVNLRTREHAQEETWRLMQDVKLRAIENWPKTTSRMHWTS